VFYYHEPLKAILPKPIIIKETGPVNIPPSESTNNPPKYYESDHHRPQKKNLWAQGSDWANNIILDQEKKQHYEPTRALQSKPWWEQILDWVDVIVPDQQNEAECHQEVHEIIAPNGEITYKTTTKCPNSLKN